jgi:hypothetical protein
MLIFCGRRKLFFCFGNILVPWKLEMSTFSMLNTAK